MHPRNRSRNSESAFGDGPDPSVQGADAPVNEGNYLFWFATFAPLHDLSFVYKVFLVHMLSNMCK